MKRFSKVRSYLFVSLFLPMQLFSVMGSTNYKIQSDSINFGGGLSSSTNYTQESTFGEIATGDSSSASYNLHAGYLQMQTTYLALTTSGNVTMSAINGLTGGTSTGSVDLHVITDNIAGYSLATKVSTNPAMQASSGGGFFSDYTPASAPTPDFVFLIASNTSAFGFSPEGPDIAAAYKDNGSACNTGSGDTADSCWNGFSTTDTIISQTTSANQPTGATTTLKLRADIGAAKIQDSGSYSATITITAVTL